MSPIVLDEEVGRRIIAAYRVAHGRGEVELDPALVRVARRQAEAMAYAGVIGHAVAGDLPSRLLADGLGRNAMAENVSAGYASVEAALRGWERSPRHDENLLFRPIRRIGIAAASAPQTRFKTYWALVMTD